MSKRGGRQEGGAPTWIVTFADLMSLLVCFFVLIISFSIQDKEKLQIVAGSVREAFGIAHEVRKMGVIEKDEASLRRYLDQTSLVPSVGDRGRRKKGPLSEKSNHSRMEGGIAYPDRRALGTSRAFALQSLRQSWESLPEVAALSREIMTHLTPEGLNIHLVDEDGRAMFAEGSAVPYPRVAASLRRLAAALRRLPNRIAIYGHTHAPRGAYDEGALWSISTARAQAAREILTAAGVDPKKIHSVSGKGDTEPLFVQAPWASANRRVSIVAVAETSPLPPDF